MKAPPPDVPTNSFIPLTARDVTCWLVKPALIGIQLCLKARNRPLRKPEVTLTQCCPASVERNVPFAACPARRLAPPAKSDLIRPSGKSLLTAVQFAPSLADR